MAKHKSIGQIAFEAYHKECRKNPTTWGFLSNEVRKEWQTIAYAVERAVLRRLPFHVPMGEDEWVKKGKRGTGLAIDHLCRNPICVNPDHMEVVAQHENKRRGVDRSRLTLRRKER